MQELNIAELMVVSGGNTPSKDTITITDAKNCTAQNVGAGNVAQCKVDVWQGGVFEIEKKKVGTPAPTDKPGPK